MAYAGPEGSLLLFNSYTLDGRLVEIGDADENVLAVVTIDDVQSGRLASAA